MPNFFKMFFASLLAIVAFVVIATVLSIGVISGLATKDAPMIEAKSVLVLDLSQYFGEQKKENPINAITKGSEITALGLYDVLLLLKKAETDLNITGILINASGNANGFATSEEIRNALLSFRKTGKFIIAQGNNISQKAYLVANAASKIFINPAGSLEWDGFGIDYVFLKGALDKLQIQPQIFYAGKFKSATEPLRAEKMTDENRLQTTVWLGDLYNHFLIQTAKARNVDTATLRRLANNAMIQTAKDALDSKLIDGLKYDDEVKGEIKTRLKLGEYDKINFVTINEYAETGGYKKTSGDRIALVFAEGNIVDGKGGMENIGAEEYIKIIRKARLDKSIKAIVFRINSGGGSSLASENIWRELTLTKKEKPVVVSFGDVAASGGYYISCTADSIFAAPTTITGSIGVFGIIPNMEMFFKNKLGVTFDGVKTSPHADAGTPHRPLDDMERRMMQTHIETIYSQFKQRVADGRSKDTAYIETIAQGRIWTGQRAKEIGLIDRFGGIQDAINCAAGLAKLKDFKVKEYPEPQGLLERFFSASKSFDPAGIIKKEIGAENYKIYNEMKQLYQLSNSVQTRLPFEFFIQ